MKTRYFLIPAISVAVIAVIIVVTVIIVNGRYLKKLSYDHVDMNAYNGVSIVGEDGLFYLVKDGEHVSDGYTFLKSVNDFYDDNDYDGKNGDRLQTLAESKEKVTLFDFYLARRADSESLWLISSAGSTYEIEGEACSLDYSRTAMPYLVFTDNQNGMYSAISLNRIDSDISSLVGNVLTMRAFTSLEIKTAFESSDEPQTYLYATSGVTGAKHNYFGADGVKVISGDNIEVFELTNPDTDKSDMFFYSSYADTSLIVSLAHNVVATDIVELKRTAESDWQYALCKNKQTGASYIVSFTQGKTLTFPESQYKLDTAWSFGSCMIITDASGAKQSIFNAFSGLSASYDTVVLNDSYLLKAQNTDAPDTYIYINRSGSAVMQSEFGDMVSDIYLSTGDCSVMRSASAGANYMFFAVVDKTPYKLDIATYGTPSLMSLFLPNITAYTLEKAPAEGSADPIQYALFSPSVNKMSGYYTAIEEKILSDTSLAIATKAGLGGSFDILDPLTSELKLGFKTSADGAQSYTLRECGSYSLFADTHDADTRVNISVVSMDASYADSQKNTSRYFAIYRHATEKSASALELLELGYSLKSSMPCEQAGNYLVAHTAQASDIYALDDNTKLDHAAHIPYTVSGMLTDGAAEKTKYFLVETDSGMKGLYDVSGKQVLPPYYANISYVYENYFTVNMRGAYGVVRLDSNGIKQAIAFKYTYLVPLGKGGYYASSGNGDTAVFYKNKTVTRASVQNVSYISSYTLSADGCLEYERAPLVSMKGKLYTYR